MENTIRIVKKEREVLPFLMGGRDREGNFYQVDNISLLKNGRRFLPVMGEFHFSRYEPEGWEEELLKMRAGGVDITATYVFWIHHEERRGEWDFSGCRNLRGFLEVCRKIQMPVWLRIGPWAHGECRNGGFPDWLLKEDIRVRTDSPVYLQMVKEFYGKLGEQAHGMMCRDGGPILGIQIENEYGHCGGSQEREEGLAHMRTLKHLAIEAGFDVPYYTATGWGGAYVIQEEMLPVLGGYVDAPWAEHVEEMPACHNFIFSPYLQDENIGSDLKVQREDGMGFDTAACPYLTAELGGGLQVTAHRRTYPWPEDIEAQTLCMLGSGANLLGYYMYHGGINPDGKYSTLQESRATGYNNDLPVKSYDFHACIRESGELGESFGKLKKLHLLLDGFGELLAGAQAYFADIQPKSPEDGKVLRVAARVNHQAGVGFLFLNNHQRKRKMENHGDCDIRLLMEEQEILIPHITVEGGECGILPFLLPGALGEWRDILPAKTNAFLLCRIGNRLFFYSNLADTYFQWYGSHEEDAVVLSRAQAERAFLVEGRLYLTQYDGSCLISKDGEMFLITRLPREKLVVYGESGEHEEIWVQGEEVEIPVTVEAINQELDGGGAPNYQEYRVSLGNVPTGQIHQLYLAVDYVGDRAEVYLDGNLVDDWFTDGTPWHIALKRFGYQKELILRIYPSDAPIPNPYGNMVYYDLSVESGCGLCEVKTLPEYIRKVGGK